MTIGRPNKRDRSPEAEARRKRHVTMDFTGPGGIFRAFAGYVPGQIFQKKPKRGWAAARRRRPFEDYFDADKLHKARLRHAWYRKQIEAGRSAIASAE